MVNLSVHPTVGYLSEVLGISGFAAPEGAAISRYRLVIFTDVVPNPDESEVLQKMMQAIGLRSSEWCFVDPEKAEPVAAFGICFGQGPQALTTETHWVELPSLSGYLSQNPDAADLKKAAWQKLKLLRQKMGNS